MENQTIDTLPTPNTPKQVDFTTESLSMLEQMYPSIHDWTINLKPLDPQNLKTTQSRSWLLRFLPERGTQADDSNLKQSDKNNPTLVIYDAENTTPREVRYVDLLTRYEAKKSDALQKRKENEGHFSYLVAKHTGKTAASEGFTFHYDHSLIEEPHIQRKNDESLKTKTNEEHPVSYSNAVMEYEQTKLDFKTSLKNLTSAYGSKANALEQYVDHETRLGSATKDAFEKRQQKMSRTAAKIKMLEQDPNSKTFMRRAKITADKILSTSSHPFSYTGAILKSTASVVLYDYNPLRVLSEKTAGKLWKAKLRHPSTIFGKLAEPLTKNKSNLVQKFATKFVENSLDDTEKTFSFRDMAADFEKRLIKDEITGRGVATGAISEAKQREAFFGGLGLALRMHVIPTVLSTWPLIRHLEIKPVEIWHFMRASNMIGSGVGSARHFVETIKHTESPAERAKLIAGATLSAPLFYLLEKHSPVFSGVNPVLMGDIGLMKLVGLAQKYSQEHGLEQTKHLRMMEAIETGITGAFAADSAKLIMEKASHTAEALDQLSRDPEVIASVLRFIENPMTSKVLTDRHLLDLITDPNILIPLLQMENRGKSIPEGIPSKELLEARSYYETLPPNPERMTLPDIIQSAVSHYEQESGKRPTWQPSKEYESWEALQARVAKGLPEFTNALRDDWASYSLTSLAGEVMDSKNTEYFLQNEGNALINHELNLAHDSWSTVIDSPAPTGITHQADQIMENEKDNPFLQTLYAKFLQPSTDIYFKNIDVQSENGEQLKDVIVPIGYTQFRIHETDRFIEKYVVDNKQPIPADELLGYFLRVDNGSLDDALWDTSMYLKLRARFDPINGTFVDTQTQNDNAQWFADHIQDNYSLGPQWNSLDTISQGLWNDTQGTDRNLDLVNKIGLGYHVFSEVALLDTVSPEFIKLMISGHAQEMYPLHGEDKVKSEMLFMQELSDTNKILEQYKISTDAPKEVSTDHPVFSLRIPLLKDSVDEKIVGEYTDRPNTSALQQFESTFTTYVTIKTLSPDSSPEDIGHMIEVLRNGQPVTLQINGVPMIFTTKIIPETNEPSLIVTDGRNIQSAQTPPITTTLILERFDSPVLDAASSSNQSALSQWVQYIMTQDATTQSELIEGYLRVVVTDKTPTIESLRDIAKSITQSDAIPVLHSESVNLPWGDVIPSETEGVYRVQIAENGKVFECTNDQLVVINQVYDKLFYSFSDVLPDQAAREAANSLLSSVLSSANEGSITKNEEHTWLNITVSASDQVSKNTIEHQKEVADMLGKESVAFHPQVFSFEEGLSYIQTQLNNPEFHLESESASIIQDKDGQLYVVTKPFLFRTAEFQGFDITPSIWVYPAESMVEAQLIQKLTDPWGALNDIEKQSFLGDSTLISKAHISSRFEVDKLTQLDSQLGNDKTLVINLGENPEKGIRENFFRPEETIYFYDGKDIFLLEGLNTKLSPIQGGYRLMGFVPPSEDVDNFDIKIFDVIYKHGSWITTNVKTLSFTEQQYLDLLAVGPMTPETVSSLQEQVTQIP